MCFNILREICADAITLQRFSSELIIKLVFSTIVQRFDILNLLHESSIDALEMIINIADSIKLNAAFTCYENMDAPTFNINLQN